MQNVLYMPELNFNLLLISQLNIIKYNTIFQKNGQIKIKNKNNIIIANGFKSNNLYYFDRIITKCILII